MKDEEIHKRDLVIDIKSVELAKLLKEPKKWAEEKKILKDNMNKKDKLFDIHVDKYHKQVKKLREEKKELIKENLKVQETLAKKNDKLLEWKLKYGKLETHARDIGNELCYLTEEHEAFKKSLLKEINEEDRNFRSKDYHNALKWCKNLIKGDV